MTTEELIEELKSAPDFTFKYGKVYEITEAQWTAVISELQDLISIKEDIRTLIQKKTELLMAQSKITTP